MGMPPRACPNCGSKKLKEITLVTPFGFLPAVECKVCGVVTRWRADE